MKYYEQIPVDPITAPVEESVTLDTQQRVFDIPQFLTGKRDSIEELNISLPTLGMLKKYDFKTISELDQRSDNDFLMLKGFGKGRVAEIRKAIALWKS
jgi:DNA-directed RNA polymerase alpha subunit